MFDLNPVSLFDRAHKRNRYLPLTLYIVLYILLCIAGNFFTGFYQTHNDFWDILYGSLHLSFDNKNSLYCIHYPIGYYAFLKLIGIKNVSPEISGIIANIFLGAGLLFCCAMLFNKLLTVKTSLLLLVLLSLFPSLFLYITNAGPDPASIVLFTIGATIIVFPILSKKDNSKRWFFLGGLFLGFGAIFRYHVFVGACLFLFGIFLVHRNNWRLLLLSVIGLGIMFLPQVYLYCTTCPHHIPFASINIYNLMYHIDWLHTSSFKFPSSFLWYIEQNPLLFMKKYFVSFLRHAPDYLPPLLAYWIVKEPLKKKLCLAILLWTLMYCLFFAAMESGRSQLLPLPFSFLCLGMFLEALRKHFPSTGNHQSNRKLIMTMVIAILFSVFVYKDVKLIYYRVKENTENLLVNSYLRTNGCSAVKEIFTNDFSIYFRTMPPYRTYFNGGAMRWGTYFFNEEYKEFPVESLKEFSSECIKRGVRFILLTDQSNKLSDALGGLYRGIINESIVFKNEIGKFKIYEVKSTI